MIVIALSLPAVARAESCGGDALQGICKPTSVDCTANEYEVSDTVPGPISELFGTPITIRSKIIITEFACQSPGHRCCIFRNTTMCASYSSTQSDRGGGTCRTKCTDTEESIDKVKKPAFDLCPAGNICCVSKKGAASTSTAAGGATPGKPVELPDPLGGVNIPTLIGRIIQTVAGVAGSVALIMFIYGGIMFIISGGESDKVKSATKILWNAGIGIVLIFGAYMFVGAIIQGILAE